MIEKTKKEVTPEVPTPPTPEQPEIPKKEISTPKEPMVTISKSAWDALNSNIEKMAGNMGMLMKIADKKALAGYYAKNKQDLPLLVHMRAINGKVIVGWSKMVANNVSKNAQDKWIVDQRVRLKYSDNTEEEMLYTQFATGYTLIPCKRMGVIQKDGQTAYELVRLDNGDKHLLDVRFIN